MTLLRIQLIALKLNISQQCFLNPTPGRLFLTFKRQGGWVRVGEGGWGGGLFGPHQENCYKSCLLHLNHLKLGTTQL